MKNFSAIILMFMSCSLGVTAQKAFQLQSPNKKTQVYIDVNKDVSFSVSQNQEILIEPSVIGMKIIGEKIVGKQPKVKKTTRTSVNRIVASPLYKKSEIKEKYNELKIDFKDKYSIVFRAYDKGIAYRFITTIKRDILVENEVALYRFPTDTKGYAAYANRGKSIEEQFTNSFENLYDNQSISKLNSDKLIILPFLVQLPNKKKICITETDLQDYPGQFLQTNGQDSSLKGIWASLPRVTKQGGHNELQQIVKERENFLAKTSGNRSFPWRIFVIASQDKDLLTSDLPYLMAEPTKSTDVSWVKPGKIAWDWWNDWNISGVDFRAGVNNQTYKYYIDFAAKNKIEYLILDEGWSVNLKADLMQVVPEINLEELVSYAKEKKVDIILWAGYWAFHRDMEKVIKHYSAMGIKGFKVDFMDRDDQQMINFMWKAAKLCNEYKMLLDFHGACKPFGLQRTYPNVINFEGVSGLEQLKWQPIEYDQVTYDVTFPFIRMLAGPVDYTQGAMRNATRWNYRPIGSEPMSQGTRCRQLAEYIIFDSPLNMLCDNPVNYTREQECTNFITSIPTVWDETVAFDSQVGAYISIARRSGDNWYIGSITDWNTRELTLDLSFLSDKTNYQIEFFRDGINSDRVASDYRREEIKLSKNKRITVKLYPGGGFAAKITKI